MVKLTHKYIVQGVPIKIIKLSATSEYFFTNSFWIFCTQCTFFNCYRPENTVFTGLEVTEDRIFLGAPRLRAGIPATLFTIPRNVPLGSSPKPQPYPDWSYHGAGLGLDNETTCAGLVSVYRMRLDSCGRLWVNKTTHCIQIWAQTKRILFQALDSGIMTSIDDFQRICNPKLVVFDLKTNQPVRTVIFPREVLRPASLLANLIIDETIQGTCDSAFVYLADTAAPGDQ